MARFLMCPPTYYGIEYEINPWMSRMRGAVPDVAQAQWANLVNTLTGMCGAEVQLLEGISGLPDLVFTANAALVHGSTAVMSRFRFPARSGEEPIYAKWLSEHGYSAVIPPPDVFFEGAGDALPCGPHLFAGYHFRSEIASHAFVSETLGIRVLSLQLTEPRFYHLDTCFCPLTGGRAMYYPGAFDEYARRVIEEYIPELITVTEPDAARFGCNAVCVDQHVVLPAGCPRLTGDLSDWGFVVHPINMSEYMKSGGAAKCLTLRLD